MFSIDSSDIVSTHNVANTCCPYLEAPSLSDQRYVIDTAQIAITLDSFSVTYCPAITVSYIAKLSDGTELPSFITFDDDTILQFNV